MKRNLLLIALIILSLSGFTQSWQWARNAGGPLVDAANGITTDIHGRIYITGTFTADTITFGIDSLMNSTKYNAFITKYDQSGNVMWTRGSIGNSKAAGTAITSDVNGNIYVTGTFNSFIDTAVIFDHDTLANIAGSFGTTDLYILKYDSLGALLWAKRAGGMGSDVSTGIACDLLGNTYISGYMGSGYSAGDSLRFGSSTIFYNGVGNMFLLKYSSAGSPLWAKTQGGNGATEAHSVATDSIGNIYVTGYYIDSAIIFGSTTLPSPGLIHFVFLTKYNSAGNVVWAKGIGGAKDDNALCVATDHSGNVYICGDYKATTTFGTITLTNSASNSHFVYIAKYDSAGTALWAKSGGIGTYNFGYGMVTDPSNNVYLTGLYEGGISFDSVTSIASGKGLFVAKYSSSGTVVWAKNVASTNPALSYGIARDGNLNLYVAGYTTGAVNFGNDTLVFHGNEDIFIAKLSNSNVGIEEMTTIQNNISIYPNPSDGNLNIKTMFSNPNAQLIITDIYGRIITSTKILGNNGTEQINLGEVMNGMYFWEVIAENQKIGNGKLLILK